MKRAKLVIDLQAPTRIPNGAVASVARRDVPRAPACEVTVDIGGETTVDLEPGDLTITLRTPDGRTQTRDVTLADDQILRLQFTTQQSPHEWLAAAAIAGAIREPGAEYPPAAEAAPSPNIAVDPSIRDVRRQHGQGNWCPMPQKGTEKERSSENVISADKSALL